MTTTSTYRPRHRAFRTAKTRPYHHRFRPRHCAGETCVHNHHDHQVLNGLLSPRYGRIRSAA